MKGKKRNAIQWLSGDTNEILLPVLKDKANECNEIAVGDPILVRTGTRNAKNRWRARPMGALLNASIGDAKSMFAGISMSESKDGETQPIRVARTGLFEMPCTAVTMYAGYVAALKTGTSSLDVDAITPTAKGTYIKAIGEVMEGATTSTTAKVEIVSSVFGYGSLDTIGATTA